MAITAAIRLINIFILIYIKQKKKKKELKKFHIIKVKVYKTILYIYLQCRRI